MSEDKKAESADWIEKCREVEARLDIHSGDIYEDSALHPCLCIEVDYINDDIWGVSLVDGSYPRACSLMNSGVRKLRLEDAWKQKLEIEKKSP
jgi:hypothetical protein